MINLFCLWMSFCVSLCIQPLAANVKTSSDITTSNYLSSLFLRQGFGYTLIGARGMAVDWNCDPPLPFKHEPQKILCDNDHFLFKECDSESSFRVVVLIHKAEFMKTFNQNEECFHAVLGPYVTAEQLLEEITTSKKNVFSILYFDNALIGILLGYGRENSLLFQRMVETGPRGNVTVRQFHWPWCLQYYSCLRQLFQPRPFSLEILPRPGFCSLKEEWQRINEELSFKVTKRENWGYCFLVAPCGFRAKQSEETNQLVEKYGLCRKILSDLFYDRNVLDVIMRELFSQHPINWVEYAEKNGLESTYSKIF